MVLVVWFLQWSIFHDQIKTRSHFWLLKSFKLELFSSSLKCHVGWVFVLLPPMSLGVKVGNSWFLIKRKCFHKIASNQIEPPTLRKKRTETFKMVLPKCADRNLGLAPYYEGISQIPPAPFFRFLLFAPARTGFQPCIRGTIEAACRVAKEVPSWHRFFFRRKVGDWELWLTP